MLTRQLRSWILYVCLIVSLFISQSVFGEVLHNSWYENTDENGSLVGYYHMQVRQNNQAYYYQLDVYNIEQNQEINASCRYNHDFIPEYLSYTIKDTETALVILSDKYNVHEESIIQRYQIEGETESSRVIQVPTNDIVFVDQLFFYELVQQDEWVLDATIQRYYLDTGAQANLVLRNYHILAPQIASQNIYDSTYKFVEIHCDQTNSESFLILDEEGFIVEYHSPRIHLERMSGTPPINL